MGCCNVEGLEVPCWTARQLKPVKSCKDMWSDFWERTEIKRICWILLLVCVDSNVSFVITLWKSEILPVVSVSCQEGPPGWTAMLLFHLPLPFHLLFFLPYIPYTSLSPTSTRSPQPAVAAAGPVLRDQPFVVVWNMPTARCQRLHKVDLHLRDFDIVRNREQHFRGQVMVFFETTFIKKKKKGCIHIEIL